MKFITSLPFFKFFKLLSSFYLMSLILNEDLSYSKKWYLYAHTKTIATMAKNSIFYEKLYHLIL